jgi:hypothetical protein
MGTGEFDLTPPRENISILFVELLMETMKLIIDVEEEKKIVKSLEKKQYVLDALEKKFPIIYNGNFLIINGIIDVFVLIANNNSFLNFNKKWYKRGICKRK